MKIDYTDVFDSLDAPLIMVDSKWGSIKFNSGFRAKFDLSKSIVSINLFELIKLDVVLTEIPENAYVIAKGQLDKERFTETSTVKISKHGHEIFLVEFVDSTEEELLIFKTMIMDLPGNIYWLSVDNVFLGCNKEQAIAAGLDDPSDIVGKTNHDMMWHDQADVLDKINNEVMRTKKTIKKIESATMYDHDKNLKDRIYYSHKIPVLSSGDNAIGVLGVSLDITELKEAQKKMESALALAEEAERRRKQFLANQEHDINTALAGIQYASVELEDVEDLSEVRETAARITRSAELLQDYNGSLLKDLAWLDDKGRVIEHRTNIRETLTKLHDINVLPAQVKKLTLGFHDIDESIPQFLTVDELVLFQCLQSLITNAINFTQEGTITLSVKRAKGYEDMPFIAFHIKDTGRGIQEENKRYVFEDYYKAVPSHQPDLITGQQANEDKGRGLGLALSLKKAQAMGGELHLESSEVGVGSEFVLSIPLKPTLNQN